MSVYVTVGAIKEYLQIAKTTIASISTVENKFNATNHGLPDGFKGKFSQTTLASPLSASTDYYVVSSSQNTFQVSTTVGGTAVDLTTTGTGILTFSSSEEDDFLNTLEEQVSAELEARCGRKFLRATRIENFRGGESTYFLGNLPVTSITSVKTISNGTETIIPGSSYDFYPSGIVNSLSVIGTASMKVEITYVGGYETFPKALESIVTQIVAIRYLKSMRGKGLLVQETMEFGIVKKISVTEEELWTQAKGFKILCS